MLDLTLQKNRLDKLDVLFIVRVHAVSHMFSGQRLMEDGRVAISRISELRVYAEKTRERGAGEYLGELEGLDIREELPDVRLHEVRSFRMGQDLQRIVVRDEVESWKYASLRLQVLLERQLQCLQLVVEFVQDFQQAG